MEITQDYAGQEATARKSLGGRRVSFMQASYVRMYDPRRKSTSQPDASQDAANAQSDENDYPGSSRRRRSSVRYSIAGSEDMDMTTVMQPGAFQPKGSAILDEEFEFEDEEENYDDDDMEVTEAIQGHFARKRSLSMGGCQPLAQVGSTSTGMSFEGNNSHSEVGNQSAQSIQSDATSEQSSYIMDFTVPLGQSLRPAEQDEVWLALKQMTHSGDQPAEPEISYEEEESMQGDDGMPLGDAVERLLRARDSLPMSSSRDKEDGDEPQDDIFTDTEDSFDEDDIDGNKTLNLSQVLGRQSIGFNSRISMGFGSNMDESEVYGDMVAHLHSTPRHSVVTLEQPPAEEAPSTQLPQPRKSLVFQPPPPPADDISEATSVPVGQPRKSSGTFSFTPAPPSPSKAAPKATPSSPSKPKPKPTFSAAFAPPVARSSPKKPLLRPTSPSVTPSKRPRPSSQDEIENADQPSPAKRQALASKWMDVAEAPKTKSPSLSPIADRSIAIPQPLSPAKKVPFQASTAPGETLDTAELLSVQSALRRPSGYFARRKSLAVSFSDVPAGNEKSDSAVAGPSTTKKKPGIGLGRASMGGTPSQAWTRPEESVFAAPKLSRAGSPSKSKGKEVEAASCIREVARQAAASPSPTRGSPAPHPPPAHQPSPEPAPTESSPEPWRPEPRRPSPEPRPTRLEQVPEETEDELSGNIEVDMDATQQWADGVEQMGYEEEEVVSSKNHFVGFSLT